MARAAEMEIITEPARQDTRQPAGGLLSHHGNQGLLGCSSLSLALFGLPNICFLKSCWELGGDEGEMGKDFTFGKRRGLGGGRIQRRNKLGQASNNKGEGNVFINPGKGCSTSCLD